MKGCSGRKKQRGSFLLIVMIVMMVMTFSGLFVMEMAMLEEVAVGNEQRTIQVYQVAYSELEAQLAELEQNPSMFTVALSGVQNLTPLVNAPGVQQDVTIRFVGRVAPPPGFSVNNFMGMSFELNSTATIDGTGAKSDQTLGVIYVTAKGGHLNETNYPTVLEREPMNKANKGFNLIELMIAMVIVGILASIMLPSYRQYVTESRRSEGVAMLLNVMQQQERYYTETLRYSADLADLGFDTASPVESENGTYQIQAAQCLSEPLERCVQLTAVAQGEQAADGDMTLNSRGVRTPQSHWL